MRQQYFWRAGVALAFGALMMTGCGDDDDNGGTGTGGAAGAATGGTAAGGTATGGAATGGMGGQGGTTQQDIVDTATAAGDFTVLLDFLEEADLVDTLRGAGPFTVFAPTDDAFDQFEEDNPGVLGDLSDEELSNVLRYHVVSGQVMSTDLEDDQEVETLADDEPTFTVTLDGDVTLTDGSDLTDDATVTSADVEASNGVIHIIDQVLLPPEP